MHAGRGSARKVTRHDFPAGRRVHYLRLVSTSSARLSNENQTQKRGRERQIYFCLQKNEKHLRGSRDIGAPNSAQALQTQQLSNGSAECTPEHAHPSSPRTRECAGACGWGMKGTRFTPFRETTRPAEHVRVLSQRGRCEVVVLGDRVWRRSSTKGAQELHTMRMCLGLQRHPWHCGTGLLRPTGDRRDAHRP